MSEQIEVKPGQVWKYNDGDELFVESVCDGCKEFPAAKDRHVHFGRGRGTWLAVSEMVSTSTCWPMTLISDAPDRCGAPSPRDGTLCTRNPAHVAEGGYHISNTGKWKDGVGFPASDINGRKRQTAGCRLGCACSQHKPPREPYVPSVTDWDLLPDAK